mmetsp:Transcript_6964/g.15373  ORF Transcript_6964/g.15373 Transcript_6964/m.15373 type:complete len:108 (+) Transcript_6964:1968-2291(+)
MKFVQKTAIAQEVLVVIQTSVQNHLQCAVSQELQQEFILHRLNGCILAIVISALSDQTGLYVGRPMRYALAVHALEAGVQAPNLALAGFVHGIMIVKEALVVMNARA